MYGILMTAFNINCPKIIFVQISQWTLICNLSEDVFRPIITKNGILMSKRT